MSPKHQQQFHFSNDLLLQRDERILTLYDPASISAYKSSSPADNDEMIVFPFGVFVIKSKHNIKINQ